MIEPLILRVQGFVQEQVEDPLRIEEGWIPFFAAADYPLRIYSMTTRFTLHDPWQRMQQHLAALERRMGMLQPVQQLLEGWDDPAVRESVLARLPHAVGAQVRADLARGGAGSGQREPLETPDAAEILAAYVEHLPAAQQQLLVAALAGGDPMLRETWAQAVTRLARSFWRRRWLQEYRAMYDRLNRSVALRSLRHYLLTWPDSGVRPQDYAALVARAFNTGAYPVDDLPPLLRCRYEEQCGWREEQCYLAPERIHEPVVAFLTAAGPLKGLWDTTVFHRVLNLDMDVAICLDIQPVSRTRMELAADQKITIREHQFQRGRAPRDVRAERELEAARAMQQDLDTQAPHDLRVVIGVQADSIDDVNQHIRQIRSACGTRLPLMRVPGQQGALARYFTTDQTRAIDAVTRPHRMMSHGVAVTVPFGMRKPDRTDGIIWMIQGTTPIMFDPFRDRRAAHMVILGKTGSGKTYAINTWGLRLLNEGVQVVMYEPQGHSRRFIAACGSGGARYILNLNQHLNVLDIIATRGEAGEPPSLGIQVEHVITQLGVLMGTSEMTAEGKLVFQARSWQSNERNVLGLALQRLYAPWADNLGALDRAETPILSHLCVQLQEVAADLHERGRTKQADIANDLAAEIELGLVEGPYGQTFNAQTSVAWDFTHDATAYDFSQIPEGPVRIYFYAQAFGALNRAVRDPGRDRNRPLVAIVDEFKYMASVPSLAAFAAGATKTWRTFGAALVTADQDAHTYLGTEGASPDESMFSVWLNSTAKVIFRQDAADARRIQTRIQGMQPFHADWITRLARGECVLVYESDDPQAIHNEVYTGQVIAIDAEHRAFSGT